MLPDVLCLRRCDAIERMPAEATLGDYVRAFVPCGSVRWVTRWRTSSTLPEARRGYLLRPQPWL
jgi:hypothetical protein